MREAIDKAIGISMTMQQFVAVMKKQGYVLELSPNRKYPTIRSINSKKAVRMYHLGDEYLPQAISNRILCKSYTIGGNYYDFIKPKQNTNQHKMLFKGCFAKTRKITGFKALYFHYCYLLGVFPKDKPERRYNPLSPEIKESLRKLERYSQQIRLICKYNLNNTDDVNAFIEQADSKISVVTTQRNCIYNKLRRCTDSEQIMGYKKHRDNCSEQLKALRKEKKGIVWNWSFWLERFTVCGVVRYSD